MSDGTAPRDPFEFTIRIFYPADWRHLDCGSTNPSATDNAHQALSLGRQSTSADGYFGEFWTMRSAVTVRKVGSARFPLGGINIYAIVASSPRGAAHMRKSR